MTVILAFCTSLKAALPAHLVCPCNNVVADPPKPQSRAVSTSHPDNFPPLNRVVSYYYGIKVIFWQRKDFCVGWRCLNACRKQVSNNSIFNEVPEDIF